MSDRSALDKRIKRHVVGRIRQYFAATAPGLESLCLEELQAAPHSVQKAEAVPGGVVFYGRLIDCYRANLYLRTAGRVLMRIDTFTANHFRELEKKCSDIPWELFLQPVQEVRVRISVKHSRLYHTGAIADRLLGGIAERISSARTAQPVGDESRPPQEVFVRVRNDRFTVSLDSSGANLHKRGIKTTGSKAPLRETTAAAILMLAGYTPPEPLVDPMCGSGTFAVEAALMASGIPAGFFRDFAFTGWPAHRLAGKRWDHLKADGKKHISYPQQPLVWASDIDRRACNILVQTISTHRFRAAIDVLPIDFFDIHPQRFTRDSGLVVLNPPYGRRIATPEGIRTLLGRIGHKLCRDFAGWKFALVVPRKEIGRQLPFSAVHFPIFHGGLHVVAAIGRVPTATGRRRL